MNVIMFLRITCIGFAFFIVVLLILIFYAINTWFVARHPRLHLVSSLDPKLSKIASFCCFVLSPLLWIINWFHWVGDVMRQWWYQHASTYVHDASLDFATGLHGVKIADAQWEASLTQLNQYLIPYYVEVRAMPLKCEEQQQLLKLIKAQILQQSRQIRKTLPVGSCG